MKKAVITMGLLIAGVFGSLLSVEPPVKYTVWPSVNPTVKEAVVEAVVEGYYKDRSELSPGEKQLQSVPAQVNKIVGGMSQSGQATHPGGYIVPREFVSVANKTMAPITVWLSGDVKTEPVIIERGGKKMFTGHDLQPVVGDPIEQTLVAGKITKKSLTFIIHVAEAGYPEATKEAFQIFDRTTRTYQNPKYFGVLERSDKTLHIIQDTSAALKRSETQLIESDWKPTDTGNPPTGALIAPLINN